MCDVRTYICFILINQQKIVKIKRPLRQDFCWAPSIYTKCRIFDRKSSLMKTAVIESAPMKTSGPFISSIATMTTIITTSTFQYLRAFLNFLMYIGNLHLTINYYYYYYIYKHAHFYVKSPSVRASTLILFKLLNVLYVK